MSYLIAPLLIAATFTVPNPQTDISVFQDIRAAQKVCENVEVNYDGTFLFLMDLSETLGWDAKRFRQSYEMSEKTAEENAGNGASGWCKSMSDKLHSYDPAYLRKVGVTRD